jgi:KEOPS complex subunit Pcc1
MQRATVTLTGPEATVVRQALRPEAGRDVPKARVRISGSGSTLNIRVEADDSGALRAALNSYLRWADVASQVSKEVRA